MTTDLFDATLANDLDAVRKLLARGADCNSSNNDGATLLMLAAGAGHQEIVEVLLESGADVDTTDALGWTALMKAIYNHEKNRGFPEIVKALIEAGADIEKPIMYGTRPLMLAAGYGQSESVELLLAAGVDVRAQNDGNRTARMMAEDKNYVDVFNLLFEAEMSLGEDIKGACSSKDSPGISIINFTRNPNH